MASRTGRLEDAQDLFRQAAARFDEIGDRRGTLSSQSELAHASDVMAGSTRPWRSIARPSAAGSGAGAADRWRDQLESVAFVAVALKDGHRAARLFGAAEALREAAGAPMTALEREEYDAELVRLREELDDEAVESAWADGRRMAPDDAVEFALWIDGCGR